MLIERGSDSVSLRYQGDGKFQSEGVSLIILMNMSNGMV